jgi:hypothetical protein
MSNTAERIHHFNMFKGNMKVKVIFGTFNTPKSLIQSLLR